MADDLPPSTLTDDDFDTGPADSGGPPATLTDADFSAAPGDKEQGPPPTLTDEDWPWDAPTVEPPSKLGSAVRRGLIEAPASTAGGLAGVGVGTLAAAPFVETGPGALVAGLAAGIPTSIAVGTGVSKLQNWLLDQLGLREGTGQLSKAQEIADVVNNPLSSMGGELASGLPVMRPGIGGAAGRAAEKLLGPAAAKVADRMFGVGPAAKLAERAIGAGAQGGLEGGRQLQTGEFDPARLGLASAAGAAFPRVGRNPFGKGAPEPEILGPDQNQPTTRGPQPKGPDQGPIIEGEYTAQDQPLTREQQNLAEDIKFAQQQRDQYGQGDPFWNFWNENLMGLHEDFNTAGKGRAADPKETQWGPTIDGEYSEVTPGQREQANDVTTVAKGIAAENPPAPEIEGAGNPVGAPMQARTAARPLNALRDYRKGQGSLEAPQAGGTTSGERSPDLNLALSDQAIETGLAQTPQAEGTYPWQGQSQPPADTVGRSQMLRPIEQDALQRIQQNQAGQQQGEAFQGLPEPQGALAQSTEQAPVTAPVTEVPPQFQQMPDLVKAIQALPAEQQAGAWAKATDLMGRQQKAARDAEKRQTVSIGVKAESKGDAARKEGVLKAYEQAAAEHGRAPANEAQGATLDRISRLVKRADELAGGKTYRPSVKPPAYQLVNAARKVLKTPTKAAMDAYRKSEIAYGAGDTELAKANQAEKRINADIELKPHAEPSTTAAETPVKERTVHEPLDNSNGDESAVFKQDHDRLTGWLNSIGDKDYARLAHDHNIDTTVRTTQDPRAAMRALQQELVEVQRQDPPHLVSPSEGAVVKRVPIKNAADLAASKGRRIDPNSAEGKAIVASLGKSRPKVSLADAELAERRAQGVDLPKGEEQAVDGTGRALMDTFTRMMADKGGAINLRTIKRQLSSWMTPGPNSLFSPKADPATIDYADQIGLGARKMRSAITMSSAKVLANSQVAYAKSEHPPLPAEAGMILRAIEDKSFHALPQPLQDWWNKHYAPMLNEAGLKYDEVRDAMIRMQWPGYETLPERKDNGRGYMSWMPRRMKRPDLPPEDPITNQGGGLTPWTKSTMERDWFTFQDANTGQRQVYRVNEDGKMVLYTNRVASRAYTPPGNTDPREIGSTMRQGSKLWVVDHSTIDELMQHGMGEVNGRPTPLKFVDNPAFVVSDAYNGLSAALHRIKLLENIINDPEFTNRVVSTEKAAKARWGDGNYEQPLLPQLKRFYMQKPLAWAFNDIVKAGFIWENPVMQFTERVAQNMIKPFYFVGGQVHVWNETDKFLIGSGGHKLPAYAKNIAKGVSTVWNNDAYAAEVMRAGGNPMFLHSKVANFSRALGNVVGEDMSLHPWKYDPIAKALNVNTRDMLSRGYQASNKLMWFQTDALYYTMYHDAREAMLGGRQMGSLPQAEQDRIATEAVKKVEAVIDSYVLPTTIVFPRGSEAARGTQKFIADPVTSLFGRYTVGVTKFIADMGKNLLNPNAKMAERLHAAAQIASLVFMYNVMYPNVLSKAYQKVTGNPDSEFEMRGATQRVSLPIKLLQGEKSWSGLMHAIWTPSALIDTVAGVVTGKDFAGRDILQPGDVGSWPAQAAEYMLGQFASPAKGVSQALAQQGVGAAARTFAEQQVGLKTPSPRAARYNLRREYFQQRDARSRAKRGRGVIEELGNYLRGK